MHACSIVLDSLQSHGLQPASLLCPWVSPSKNTGVGCHFLFQGIFPIKPRSLALQTDFFSHQATSVKALAAQSCLTLCDLMDCSLPGSSVLEFPKARILEWVAISFSMESS